MASMHKSLLILGRQPAIGIAELESLYGARHITPMQSSSAALLDIETSKINFDRLGGSIKLCEVIDEFSAISWLDCEKQLIKVLPEYIKALPESKITIGISVFGLSATAPMLTRTGLTIKKIIKKTGRPVRLVPNKEIALSSAQVLHNNLCGERGFEFVFVKNGPKVLVAKTVAEQNIESYTARDQARPKRDARVGMLPPKLAQTIINLSTGAVSHQNKTVLDPFCGTGVLLQEALLMGCNVYGTDIEPRMVEYSTINLTWLQEKWVSASGHIKLETGDATKHAWQQPFDFVATETYLGEPISQIPDPAKLAKLIDGTDGIHFKMLGNLHKQLPKGARLCLAVPAWRTKRGFAHLPTLDQLDKLGYTRMVFEHAKNDDLIYAREDQFVGRELVVLEKK
jgi:tRNA G10  N-methylase Trm11